MRLKERRAVARKRDHLDAGHFSQTLLYMNVLVDDALRARDAIGPTGARATFDSAPRSNVYIYYVRRHSWSAPKAIDNSGIRPLHTDE